MRQWIPRSVPRGRAPASDPPSIAIERVLHHRHAAGTSDRHCLRSRVIDLIEAFLIDARAFLLFLPHADAARAAAKRAILAQRRSLQASASPLRVALSTISITSRVWTFSSSCLALMPSP